MAKPLAIQRCKTCIHFERTPERSDPQYGAWGFCVDERKVIYGPRGMDDDEFDVISEPIEVHERHGCIQHVGE